MVFKIFIWKELYRRKEVKTYFFLISYLTFCFMLFRFKMFMRLKAIFFFSFIYVFIEKNLQQCIYLLVWLAVLFGGLQDLSSLTRDGINVPCSGITEPWPLDHQGIPWVFILQINMDCWYFAIHLKETWLKLQENSEMSTLPHHLIGKKWVSCELMISKPPGHWRTEMVSSFSHFCYWHKNMNRNDRNILDFL